MSNFHPLEVVGENLIIKLNGKIVNRFVCIHLHNLFWMISEGGKQIILQHSFPGECFGLHAAQKTNQSVVSNVEV